MSVIVNESKKTLKLVDAVRGQLEQRAMWLALLYDEAEAKGLDVSDFGREAIYKCGCIQGKTLSGGSKSFKTLKKNLFGWGARQIFQMKILSCDDDHLSIDFHYCPLVKAWQKMGYDDEKIAKLCDTAMCGDRGIASNFDGELNLESVIAKGAPCCKIRFRKKKQD